MVGQERRSNKERRKRREREGERERERERGGEKIVEKTTRDREKAACNS